MDVFTEEPFNMFIEVLIITMSTGQLKNKQTPTEGSEPADDKQWFSNPISKSTFEALPKIYGIRKNKKLSVRQPAKLLSQDTRPKKHTIDRQPSQQGTSIPITFQDKPARFKTQMKSYDKRSNERLSNPKGDYCNKRYCCCNKLHEKEGERITRSATKDKIKHKPAKLTPLKPGPKNTVKEDSKEPCWMQNDGETRHKVVTSRYQQDTPGQARHLSLLDFLRNGQQDTTRSNQLTSRLSRAKVEQPTKKANAEVQFPLMTNSIEVQTQNPADRVLIKQPSEEEIPLKGKSQALESCLPEKQSKKAASSLDHRAQKKKQESVDNSNLELFKGPSYEEEAFRLQKLRAQFNEMQIDSDSDDGKSIISSVSSASISKHLFEGEKKGNNTMFHTLTKQETLSSKSSKVNKSQAAEPKIKREKYVMQKKNGLFVIPQEDQYVDFLKGYQPMNQKFAVKRLVRKEHFKVVPSQDGVFFGQYVNDQRNGKGLMITERTIFEGKYKNNQKTYGCEKNIDGVYKGQFVNGVREGYGTFSWYNGEVFEGQWRNGTKNGFGIWRSPKGDFYQGGWLLNRQHGKGTFHHRTSTFRGQFVNFLKEGQGQELFSNGDKYAGSYKKGKPDGQGKYQWADGSYYEGHFSNGLRSGRGKWVYNKGAVYQGEFKKDFKDGYGKQTYKSGENFQGLFREGNRYEGIMRDKEGNMVKVTPESAI